MSAAEQQSVEPITICSFQQGARAAIAFQVFNRRFNGDWAPDGAPQALDVALSCANANKGNWVTEWSVFSEKKAWFSERRLKCQHVYGDRVFFCLYFAPAAISSGDMNERQPGDCG